MFCVLYFGLVMLRIELSHTFMDILVSVGVRILVAWVRMEENENTDDV